MNLLADWKEAQQASCQTGHKGDKCDLVWKKPKEGRVKLNTDAAVFNDGSIGVGCVLRDAQGRFLGARSCRKAGAWTPREAEAIGMKEALSWMLTWKHNHCVVETDSKNLVDACNGRRGEAYFESNAKRDLRLSSRDFDPLDCYTRAR
ncbi:hypothetical protein AgCh_036571 [Apium graveolens]